ncbi:MAG: PKD domain-containing protein [Candidatus Poribacteria bacterium]|nr:PKD domain-containing protein [Candidatus Poribacteria bacterium]
MRRFLGFVAYIAVVCLAIPSLVFAQATVSIDPENMESPDAEQEFAVSVTIAAAENVYGYAVSVTFDPTAVEFVSIAAGDFLPGALGPPTLPPIVEEGKVTFSATFLGQVPGVSGDGTLATVTFKVVEKKSSTIGLEGIQLADPDANPLPDAITVDGQITGPVVVVNEPPVAVIEAPTEATIGETVSLSGAGSTDDGEIVSYVWDFGDGSDPGEGDTVTHAYAAAGDFTVTLTVTDNGEPALTGEATVTVTLEGDIVAVHPKGKKVTTWGQLKAAR